MSLRVAKNFRVHHDHIVAVEPYSGGVGITRDGVRAKLETFLLVDGWFTYSFLQNIEVPQGSTSKRIASHRRWLCTEGVQRRFAGHPGPRLGRSDAYGGLTEAAFMERGVAAGEARSRSGLPE